MAIDSALADIVRDAVSEALQRRDQDPETKGQSIDLVDANGKRIASLTWPIVPMIGSTIRLFRDKHATANRQGDPIPAWVMYKVLDAHYEHPWESGDTVATRIDVTLTVEVSEQAPPEPAW